MDDGSAMPQIGRGSRGGLDPVLAVLRRLRRWTKFVLTTERLGVFLAAALGSVFVLAVADFFLRSPSALRLVMLVTGLGVLAVWGWKRLIPVVRFAPSLTELALRIERTAEGAQAGLRGVLASGVDLSRQREEGESLALAAPVIIEAAKRVENLRTRSVVRQEGALRSLGLLALVAVIVGGTWVTIPDLSRIGAMRVLMPLADVAWPKRTGVADATGAAVHPLGAALPLRAVLTKSDTSAERTRVAAEYRLVSDGVAGPWRKALLTSQDRTVDVPGVGAGTLFERLIEPANFAPADARGAAGVQATGPAIVELEYRFATSDDETALARVLLVEPPAVTGASLEITEPEYARAPGEDAARRVDLGTGIDERAAPPASLSGSTARLSIALNKDVPAEKQFEQNGPAWLAAALGEDVATLLANDPEAKLTLLPRVWMLEWTLSRPVRIGVKIVDEHGIADSEERSFTLDVLEDNAPSAVVLRPDHDKSVLATAVIELAGEGRDDVGLEWVALERQIARRPQGSEGAAPEAQGPPESIARVEAAAASAPAQNDNAGGFAPRTTIANRQVLIEATLDLATLNVKAGDEVWITALAADAYALGELRHEPARSVVRKLRIMSREELLEQVWNQLSDVRRGAIQLEAEQRELQTASGRPGEQSARQSERAQAGLTERLSRQQEAIGALEQRLEENAMAEPTLEAILQQSRQSLQRAGQSSGQAGQSLAQAAQESAGQEASPQAGEEERKAAQQAQEEVREELSELIEMLDQGQDTWAAKRSIEQALERQRQLRDRTAEAGQRTTGRSAEQLTPQERQELAQIAQEQGELSEQTREAIQDMLDREKEMQKKDPAAAQAMAQAARRGQREQVPEKMHKAAQQAQQNQTNNAQQQQQQAMEALEQMLSDLEQTAKNRDEVLRRVLASLIESLDALIAQQAEEIAGLDRAKTTGQFAGLDRGMTRLHTNTLGVLDEANNGPREIVPVARLIDEAASAQVGAIGALRRSPVDSGEAQGQEELSLTKLREARELAEKLDREAQQREQNRKKAELKKKYAAAFARQVSLRDSTQDLAGVELTRRVRNSARLIGEDQQALRTEIAAMLTETRELSEAKVFEYAHKRLDELMAAASDRLGEGEPDAGVLRRQTSAARVLQSLIDALDSSKQEDEDFREQEQDQQGGGGGQAGQQPLVPPAAELKLLRSMQQEAIEMTREADEGAPSTRAAVVEDAIRLQDGIATQARQLLDRLAEQNGQGAPRGIEPGSKSAEPPPADPPPADPPPAEPARPEPTPAPQEPAP